MHTCMMVFFFLLALSITPLTLLHRESIHLFGWGVEILWVIYTFYSVEVCEIVEGGGLYLCFVSFSVAMHTKVL